MHVRKPLKAIFVMFLLHSACLFPSRLIADQTANPQAERDRQQESAVASLFDEARKQAKLRPLSKIRDRKSLEQLVCTAAVTGKVPRSRRGYPLLATGATQDSASANPANLDKPSALYKTTNPQELTPELKGVALYERPRGPDGHSRPGFARYSVAVWPAQQQADGKAEYWVGVQLYWSAGAEFFENNFSDAME